MITPHKIAKLLTGPNGLHKALVAINSTPLRRPIKGVLDLFHVRQKSLRRKMVRTLEISPRMPPLVDNLRRDGYSIVGPLMDRSLLDELREASGQLVRRADAIQEAAARTSGRFSTKNFWARLLDEEMAEKRLTMDSIFVRYAMQPELVGIVANYFGEVPVLGYVFLSLSRHVPQPLTASQLWHRDHDDVKVVKLFTYLSDVEDHGCGPFTFYPKKVSQAVRESFVPKHIPDDQILRQTGDAKPLHMFGPTFASFLVDTGSCYHMGSRVEEGKSRLMYTASFISAPPMFPNFSNHIVINRRPSDVEELLLRA